MSYQDAIEQNSFDRQQVLQLFQAEQNTAMTPQGFQALLEGLCVPLAPDALYLDNLLQTSITSHYTPQQLDYKLDQPDAGAIRVSRLERLSPKAAARRRQRSTRDGQKKAAAQATAVAQTAVTNVQAQAAAAAQTAAANAPIQAAAAVTNNSIKPTDAAAAPANAPAQATAAATAAQTAVTAATAEAAIVSSGAAAPPTAAPPTAVSPAAAPEKKALSDKGRRALKRTTHFCRECWFELNKKAPLLAALKDAGFTSVNQWANAMSDRLIRNPLLFCSLLESLDNFTPKLAAADLTDPPLNNAAEAGLPVTGLTAAAMTAANLPDTWQPATEPADGNDPSAIIDTTAKEAK